MSEFIVPSVRTTEPGDIAVAADETSASNSTNEVPAVEISSAGATSLTGQAAALMTLAPPAPGETIVVTPQSGATYVLDFGPREASVSAEGGNLVLSFDDSGDGAADRQIVFEDIAQLAEAGEAPTLQIAGTSFSADTLFNEAQALAGEAAPLETAAADGPDALGGGATAYSDNLGDVIKLLQALGVIPPTELEFGLTDLEDDPDLILLGEALPEASELFINEISLDIPTSFINADGELVDGYLYSVEFYNPAAGSVETLDLTVEFLNPAGVVVSFAIPNGIDIPPGGFLVLSQIAGIPEVTLRVMDADGTVVGEQVVAGADDWGLGSDTTEAIAVNLVFQAGTDNETGVDTFAANLDAADLGALSSPTWVSNEAGSDLLPSLNFETFFGGLSPAQNIFSRVFNEDGLASGAPLDSDTEADWTTNSVQTDGALNNTNVTDEGALVINSDNGNEALFHVAGDGSITMLVSTQDILDLTGAGDVGLFYKAIAIGDDGSIYFAEFFSQSILRLPPDGPLETFVDGADVTAVTMEAGAGYMRGLTFGPDGMLYVVDDESGSILRMDPTVAPPAIDIFADIEGMAEFAGGIDDITGVILSADGTQLYLAVDATVAGEDAIVAIDIASGVTSILATDLDFNALNSFMVLAPNGDIIVADAGFDDELFRITPDGVVSIFLSGAELDAVTGIAGTELRAGFWFDSEGNFFIGDSETDTIYRFNSVDPLTGEVDPLGFPLVSEAQIIAALGGADLQAGALQLPLALDILGFSDPNPSDPIHDDTNPGQANGDPLAGQSVLVADSDAGVLLEGFGGPDVILGGAGDDTVYGGSQAMVVEQSALNSVDPGEAPDAGFSDHNDLLFGDAGDDAMYGGSGSDLLIGGLGADSVDGGSGGDRISGHDDPAYGGVPAGDPGDPLANADVLAGDGLNNTAAAEATVNLGGIDTIYGGFGDNIMSGEALAFTEEGSADGFARNDGLVDPGEGGGDSLFGGENVDMAAGEALAYGGTDAVALGQNTSQLFGSLGSDFIYGGQGSDFLAGESFALALNGDAEAASMNEAEVGNAGRDTILGDAGDDQLAGEAFAQSEQGDALAIVENLGNGGFAGNDELDGGDGNNVIAGEAVAFGFGTAEADIDIEASDGGIAGSDQITGGVGANQVAGEAVVFAGTAAIANVDIQADGGGVAGNDVISIEGPEGGLAAGEVQIFSAGTATVSAVLEGDGEGSEAGNDSITLGSGINGIGGEVYAFAVGDVEVTSTASASAGALVAGDTLIGGADGAAMAGDVLVNSLSGIATVEVVNDVAGGGLGAGLDTLEGGDDDNLVAGDALVSGNEGSTLSVMNSADGGDAAGRDFIVLGSGDNRVAGDAFLLADGLSSLTVDNTIVSAGLLTSVGSDSATVGDGGNEIAGDALGDGDEGLSVTVNNTADGDGSVGSDNLNGGDGGNRIAGDAFVIGGGLATVTNVNNVGAGAAVGNDIITSGLGVDTLSGDALVFDGGTASVTNSADAGNDEIDAGDGADLAAGDALVFGEGGTANSSGGDDTIRGEEGNDTIAGDVMGADGADANATDAGDDTIFGGAGADLISGDVLVIGGGTGSSDTGGDDLIEGGAGDDIIYGDSNDGDIAGGSDTIEGGADNDLLYGNSGDDTLDGGTQSDTLYGGDGLDLLIGGAGLDTLYGGADADVLNGNGDADFLDGGAGDDTLDGGTQNDILYGGADDDLLIGWNGADDLYGGTGADILEGGIGSDFLDGGDGDDTLTGGGGADTFAFSNGASGTDTITDFNGGSGDVIDLTDLLEGLVTEDGATLASFLEVTFDGVDSTIAVDANGDLSGFTDQTIVVEGQDLVGGGATQEDIIQALIDSGALNADAA